MTKRVIAVSFIFVCTSIAWMVLGGTIFQRTYDSGPSAANSVASTWGTEQNQAPPAASFKTVIEKTEETLENGKKILKPVKQEIITNLPLESSNIDVALDLAH